MTEYVSASAVLRGHLEAREPGGLTKYGKPVHAFNGRNPLKDKREELLDALVYNEQDILERESIAVLLGKVAAFVELIADQLTNSPEEVIVEIREMKANLQQDIKRIEPEDIVLGEDVTEQFVKRMWSEEEINARLKQLIRDELSVEE